MLDTQQIENQLRGIRYFIGVYPVDRLPDVRTFPATMIVNTDPSNEGGEHWVALHLHPGGQADYFCSFGFPPLIPELQSFLKRYGSACKRYNRCTMQDVNSSLCGDYCICYVKCVAKGIELPEFVAKFSNVVTGSETNKRRLTCLSSLSC